MLGHLTNTKWSVFSGGGFNISPLKPRNGRPRTQVQHLLQIDLKGWGAGYISSFQQHCLLQVLNSVAGKFFSTFLFFLKLLILHLLEFGGQCCRFVLVWESEGLCALRPLFCLDFFKQENLIRVLLEQYKYTKKCSWLHIIVYILLQGYFTERILHA